MISSVLSVATLLVAATTAFPLNYFLPRDPSDSKSCLSLRNACNANVTDLSNFYNNTACVLLTVCSSPTENPASTLNSMDAPATQPRMTQAFFETFSGGSDSLTQQAYIDAYYHQISITPNGTYPASVNDVITDFTNVAAWTGSCDSLNIPYSNFADWLEYSSVPGVCPAVASCDASVANSTTPCVPQPVTDNGSCAEVAAECELWVTGGLFQNEFCVLASMCYAESTTDVLIKKLYPSYVSNIPTSLTEQRLSQGVFYNITQGAETMTEQNVIDAYYGALTGTYQSLGGPFGAETPGKTSNNGPYPTSTDYVSNFWSIISAWTGMCDTKEIPYENLADYLTYAATSGYHPTC
ncbi:hypothetical protein SERLA73DRAFT_181738 [Serpula lacrymans var. lacrymans S7.3]|uniref:Uncharacterized protein n=2 Tax=Serpula lacrymans var. lacrymans TaxID=341189 RepID=F8PYL4_SERL3|nr:uncharacterized protein SERLADRAFT_468080 [Serpula lacrymans var. lacrymans S7.9]EGN98977.1 hypothetical protein SERLA73DRAFT_181738 [Serpula lacrymans var. lacrymans S7.3]EGO24565.1 hypothetical protein SERLADRAFT_468080 [Serpula lacrymans var. lacrymans S7.9]